MSSVALSVSAPRRWPVLVAMALGMTMIGIDATIVSVANATIGSDLQASLGDLEWVTNAYLLALTVLLLPAGRIADRFGRRRVFLIGTAGFGLASAGCALAGSVDALIAWRTLQGAAGALMMPSSLAIVRATFADDLDRALAIWGGASTVSFVAGPIVGGLLVEHVSWQSVFVLNLPIAALACMVTLRFAPESRDPAGVRSYDVPGFVLLTTGLFLLVFALVHAHAHEWGSPRTLGAFAAGLALIALLVLREARTRYPMIPLDIFRSPSVLTAATTILAGYLVSFGVIFFWALYLQQTLNDTPIEAGVHLLPQTASFVVGCPIAGWLASRIGRRKTMIGGMVAVSIATVWLGKFDVTNGYGTLWLPLAAVGFALAFAQIVAMQTMMDETPERYAGIAGGLLSGAAQLGGVLGVAILGSVFASSGIHDAMYVAAAVELGAAIIAAIVLCRPSVRSRIAASA